MTNRVLCVSAVALLLAVARPAAQELPAYTFSTFAGVPTTGIDGTGAAAAFASPKGIAVDASGNLYVADNSAIRKITPAGEVSTFAGRIDQSGHADGPADHARLSSVVGLTMGPNGTIYFTEATTVRSVSPSGVVSTLAGFPGVRGDPPVDGVGDAARFTELRGGIAVASDGVVFVADRYRIRMVTPAGVVTTLAGQSGFGASDGTGSDAAFGAMTGLVVGTDGDLLVAEEGVYISSPTGGGLCCGNAIRRVTRAGVVTTVAGVMGTEGGTDGAGATARLSKPAGMALAPDGTVRFLDYFGKVRALTGNVVTTVSPASPTGAYPQWIAVGADGAVYVTDTSAQLVQRITSDGSALTIAGGATAVLVGPSGVARGADGTLYIADYYGHQIRALSPSGVFSVVPAAVNFPTGIAIDCNGTLYIADYGNGRVLRTRPEGPAEVLFSGGSHGVRAVAARGTQVVVVSGHAILGLDPNTGSVISMAGSLTAEGSTNGPSATARFRDPWGVAIDSAGQVFVADSFNATIRRIDSGGIVTTLAGSVATYGSADGVGSSALFNYPRSLTVDAAGDVIVSDSNNSTIRRVSPDGTVRTIAGVPQLAGSSDGVAGAVLFNSPWGIVVDPNDVLWVADFQNGTIRRGEAGASATVLSVVSQPQNVQVSVGQRVSLGFETSGVPDAQTRWQQSVTGPSGEWSFVADSSTFGGSLTRVLTIRQPTLAINGLWFRALANNGVSSLVSDAVQLSVTGAPSVGMSPSGQSVLVGATATFQVTASGGAPAPTYQWERSTDGGATFAAFGDDAQHVGTATNTLNVTPSSTALQGTRYRAVLTNSFGTATSSAATLTVLTLAITSNPTSLTVRSGDPATFTVVASGVGTLSYQWQQQWDDVRYPWVDLADGGAFTGTRTATLTINPTSGALHGYSYRAVVTMGSEQATSQSAQLNVQTTQLVVTPAVLRFAAVKDGAAATTLSHVTAPQQLTVGYTGNTVPRWTVTSDQPWLHSSLTTAVLGAAAPELSIVNPGNVIGGETALTATVTITVENMPWLTTTATVHLTVDQSGATTAPFGALDTPVSGSSGHAGAMAVTGWALDDVGVTEVQIWRECLETIDRPRGACQSPKAGDSDAVYVGQALFVAGARPDVAALYPALPLSGRAGWGLLVLTNMLPYRPDGSPVGGQGTFTFHAYAVDVEGNRTRLGSTTVDIDNDGAVVPFGAIDTPTPGETLTNPTGRFISQGWALARGGRCLAGATASTWRVYIDGVLLTGPQIAIYGGQLRPDVRDAFPASCGSETSGMFSVIEGGAFLTTGQHTISWEAVDPDGRVGAFGSRFFNVLFPSADADTPVARSDGRAVVAARQGWRNEVQATIGATDPVIIRPDHQGVHALVLAAGRRLHLDLGGAVISGHQVVADETQPLPGGSRLDAAGGVFTWEPPLGYLGRFQLVFDAGNGPLRIEVTIR